MVIKVDRRAELNWDFGFNMCILLYIKHTTNKELLYSTVLYRNYTKYFIPIREKNLKNNGDIYICKDKI